ncbi:ACT domain-containing protein [Cohnella sp. JJ-181]|uniref:ACT domain-containing protein n=1 Tax=Cohnella rhizoplanae TaxID=2974897 RepID=UPI0022FF8E7C|nr:ACT domain-containing protein [Cohnella sp. JJ-181]CAI6082394.1 hypothetical protein COHCIP112018_03629 [Cohnella sp. JJ-181]
MAEQYYAVRGDLLPEGMRKAEQAKALLRRGEVATINEAAERVGLSRSAFYKYKDGVYPLDQAARESIATLSIDLEHRSGILSRMLALIADNGGNVLTITQSIPLQGLANVVATIDAAQMTGDIGELVERLKGLSGVRRASVVGRS